MSDIRGMIEEYLGKTNNEPEASWHERLVLSRVAANPRAHAALNAIAKNTDEIWGLIQLCIDAELVMGTFRELLTEERETVDRLNRYRQSVKDLKQFIDQAAQHPQHSMVDWMALPQNETGKQAS